MDGGSSGMDGRAPRPRGAVDTGRQRSGRRAREPVAVGVLVARLMAAFVVAVVAPIISAVGALAAGSMTGVAAWLWCLGDGPKGSAGTRRSPMTQADCPGRARPRYHLMQCIIGPNPRFDRGNRYTRSNSRIASG